MSCDFENGSFILLAGWRVDFNLPVSSFEDNIAATRRLVDLALESPHAVPPRLLFVSSVGLFRSQLTVDSSALKH